MSKYNYTNPFSYKLIYIFRINDDQHSGILKVGDTSIDYAGSPDDLTPSCELLNKAAKERINQYTRTAGIKYELLYTELAFYKGSDGKNYAFIDKKLHKVLTNSGIQKVELYGAQEWFKTDLETVKNAIAALKAGRKSLSSTEISEDKSPIVLRPSQIEAVEKTVKYFKKKSNKQFLWNAKMRFGKTLAAMEVAKRLNFAKTLILTHRPAVSEGWFDDFKKVFYDVKWYYGSNSHEDIDSLLKRGENFIYFKSIQDLRGSAEVGGKFAKNQDIFKTDWDFLIIDEAHEGTRTNLGKDVLDSLKNGENTKVLFLSGTPFNLVSDFNEDETYSWTYVDEQRAKQEWFETHLGDSNPYGDLPSMKIYTFELSKQFKNFQDSDKAFNFREFFRVWTGDALRDGKNVSSSEIGHFVHEKDVRHFLDLISHKSDGSMYPFATEEFRGYFNHTLWMVPGVREAKALSALLKEHEIFRHFEIANVAGDGDEEQNEDDALKVVRNAIDNNQYTITLSCGKLTTGVTVKEWTAVLMLAGAYSTSAMGYLQTIFRVQSPAIIDGRQKEVCYVFDFAPDRTLKMMADAVNMSTKAGKTDGGQKKAMGKLLNFCPIISIDGTNMREYDVDQMLTQLKRAYIDKVSQNGFDDAHIYNYNIGAFTEKDKEFIKHLSAIVKASNQSKAPSDIPINDLGFDNEEHEKDDTQPKSDSQTQKSEDNKKRKEERERRRTLISNLRAISIRIPLLVYGADIPFEQDINIDNLTDIVDDVSWEEFMPKGLSKEDFKRCKKFYDETIFVGAGRAIRNRIKDAEKLPVMERVKEIAEIFGTFRNPDKETVLTPWRVVNMHLGNCIGGFNFFDEDFKRTLETPRCIDHGKVSKETVWNTDAKILEVNSKTGLYPLYMAYSIFTARRQKKPEVSDEQHWADTLKDNIFVLCKTPMAVSITRRTLAGFRNLQVNAKYRKDLVKDAQEESSREKLASEIQSGKNFWKINEDNIMKFDAIVGNPPYQEAKGTNIVPIFNHFMTLAKEINPRYISMIMPSRWMKGGNRGLDDFMKETLADTRIELLHDYIDPKEVFPGVEIKGGVCYLLWGKSHKGMCKYSLHDVSKKEQSVERYLKTEGCDSFVRYPICVSILEKVRNFNEQSFSGLVSVREPYGLKSDFFKHPQKYGVEHLSKDPIKDGIKIYGLENLKRVERYVPNSYKVKRREETLNSYKIFIPNAYGCGAIGEELGTPILGTPMSICTETFYLIGPFQGEDESKNALKYLKTKFFRLLVGLKKITQHTTRDTYSFVPIQDFSRPWTDGELYKKYALTDEEIDFIETMIKPMK